MQLSRIKEILGARVLVEASGRADPEIKAAGGSDLMSDVLAFAKPGMLLLTGLTNEQSIRTAEIADIYVVCYVRGKQPTDQAIELAKKKNITILTTDMKLYEACGQLYAAGLPPIVD